MTIRWMSREAERQILCIFEEQLKSLMLILLNLGGSHSMHLQNFTFSSILFSQNYFFILQTLDQYCLLLNSEMIIYWVSYSIEFILLTLSSHEFCGGRFALCISSNEDIFIALLLWLDRFASSLSKLRDRHW